VVNRLAVARPESRPDVPGDLSKGVIHEF
jgi:hypothetical protein